MSDDLSKRGQQDRSRIAMQEEHEVRHWTQALGVTREELQATVDRVGNSAAAVREALSKQQSQQSQQSQQKGTR
jgi:hypothetical protein